MAATYRAECILLLHPPKKCRRLITTGEVTVKAAECGQDYMATICLIYPRLNKSMYFADSLNVPTSGHGL